MYPLVVDIVSLGMFILRDRLVRRLSQILRRDSKLPSLSLHLEHVLQLNLVLLDQVARLNGAQSGLCARTRAFMGVWPRHRLNEALLLDALLVQAELNLGSADAIHEGVARYRRHLLALAERIT